MAAVFYQRRQRHEAGEGEAVAAVAELSRLLRSLCELFDQTLTAIIGRFHALEDAAPAPAPPGKGPIGVVLNSAQPSSFLPADSGEDEVRAGNSGREDEEWDKRARTGSSPSSPPVSHGVDVNGGSGAEGLGL